MPNPFFRLFVLGLSIFLTSSTFAANCKSAITLLSHGSSHSLMKRLIGAFDIASTEIGEARYGLLSVSDRVSDVDKRLMIVEVVRRFTGPELLGNPSPHGVTFRWANSKRILAESLPGPSTQVHITEPSENFVRGCMECMKGYLAIRGFQQIHFRGSEILGSQSFGSPGFPQTSVGMRLISEFDPIEPLKNLLSDRRHSFPGVVPEIYSFDIVGIDLRGPRSEEIPDDRILYYNLFHILTAKIGDEMAFLVTKNPRFSRLSKADAYTLYGASGGNGSSSKMISK